MIKSILQLDNKIMFESFAIAETRGDGIINKFKNFFEEHKNLCISSFPKMSLTEYSTWAAYCPTIEGLDKCTIPLHEKAIEILEHAKKNNMFHYYEIWSEADAEIDPVLVGVNLKKSYNNQEGGMQELLAGRRYPGQNDYFLMCRWGESLKPFQEIKEIAFKRSLSSETIAKRTEIKRLTRELEDLEDELKTKFGYFN